MNPLVSSAFRLAFLASLLPSSCGSDNPCEGKPGGLAALKVVNSTDCDLNVTVDQGGLLYVPARGTGCQTDLGGSPLAGNHTVQSIKNKTGEICETRTLDFGSAPSDAEAKGPVVNYSPSIASCICEEKSK